MHDKMDTKVFSLKVFNNYSLISQNKLFVRFTNKQN